ncbi:MAG: hypothetical protein MJZ34_05025 [Paludibacteraceae bacterium]|nr:hypothetical protein [Paludibacteraceae bacterium]
MSFEYSMKDFLEESGLLKKYVRMINREESVKCDSYNIEKLYNNEQFSIVNDAYEILKNDENLKDLRFACEHNYSDYRLMVRLKCNNCRTSLLECYTWSGMHIRVYHINHIEVSSDILLEYNVGSRTFDIDQYDEAMKAVLEEAQNIQNLVDEFKKSLRIFADGI